MKKITQILSLIIMGLIGISCCGTTVGNGEQCNPNVDPDFFANDILQYVSTEGGFSVLYPYFISIDVSPAMDTVSFNDGSLSQVSFTILGDLPSDLMIYAQSSGLCPLGSFIVQNDLPGAEGVVCMIENSPSMFEAIYLLQAEKLVQAHANIQNPVAIENVMDDVLRSFMSHGQ